MASVDPRPNSSDMARAPRPLLAAETVRFARPHNTGHYTLDACATSQFEQQVRAVCGLALGDPALRVPGAAMVNLLGDLWDAGEPTWSAAIRSHTALHLYGKAAPRPGRKMGHLTAWGDTSESAELRALDARRALTGG